MTCDICKEKKFVYEKKVLDELITLCEDCDWSTEDIKEADKIGQAMKDKLSEIMKEMFKD